MSPGERPAEPRRVSVRARGTEVVVREWGESGVAPLVFWHGVNPFGSLQLNEAGPTWAQRGFRVIAPAAPGMGESPTLPDLAGYRPTRLADLVIALADSIDIGRFAFVGWSWGASIGVHLAVRHGDRLTALVLLDAGHTDAQDMPDWADSDLDERIAEYEKSPVSFPSWEDFFATARERATEWRTALEDRLRAGMHETDAGIVARGDPSAAAAALHWQAVIRTIASEHDLLAHAPKKTMAPVGDWLAERSYPRVA